MKPVDRPLRGKCEYGRSRCLQLRKACATAMCAALQVADEIGRLRHSFPLFLPGLACAHPAKSSVS